MLSFKDYCKLDEARKGNPYDYEKDSGAKGLAHKVGDSVWAKHPTEKYKTLAGKVTKIGRTLTTLQHKDGTVATYPHADVSSNFEKLNPYRKNESEEVDEGAPIVVPFAHSLKQAADQRKQLAADKEKLRASIVTPYQLGKKHKAEGKQNSNPHKFVKSAGAAGNYEHNAYNRGFNESTELDESGWIGGIAKWKEACKKNGLTTGHN